MLQFVFVCFAILVFGTLILVFLGNRAIKNHFYIGTYFLLGLFVT